MRERYTPHPEVESRHIDDDLEVVVRHKHGGGSAPAPISPMALPVLLFGAAVLSFASIWLVTASDRSQIDHWRTEAQQQQERAEAAEREAERIKQCIYGG